MLLKLLSLALSNLEIGSNDGIKFVSSFNCSLFHFTSFLPLHLDCRHAIESELYCVLGCLNLLPILFRHALWYHVAAYEWSSDAKGSRCWQTSSVHPMLVCELRLDSSF